jgi:hypothetical protein
VDACGGRRKSRFSLLLRLGFFLALVSSVTLFAAGAYVLGLAPRRLGLGGSLRVEPKTRWLGDLRPGVEVPVSFTVTNLSDRPARMLGATQFCTTWGCVWRTEPPVKVPPHGSGAFGLRLRPRAQFCGEFSCDVILFSDAPGHGQTPVRIRGNVLPCAEH